jgi:ATP-dependent Clp protease ATP-binding subunit ClpC
VFERFTQEGRHVVVYALEEVRAFSHERVGSEHLLLGLLRDEGVTELLGPFDVTHERVRARVEEIVGPGVESPEGQIPFTSNSKRVLQAALTEADLLKRAQIAPGHILLGLQATVDCLGARILRELGADAEAVRRAVVGRLTAG